MIQMPDGGLQRDTIMTPAEDQTPDAEHSGADARFESVVEAILFASGEPLALDRISLIIERPPSEVKPLLAKMEARLRSSDRGLLLREISGKYQLCTKPELSRYVGKLSEIRQKQALSQAAYETLSIIAYNVNVTRATIEKIRGVNSDSSLSKLLERGLVAEAGRADLPGKPMRYDVTDDFYRLFGFNSRSELVNEMNAAQAGAQDEPEAQVSAQDEPEAQISVHNESEAQAEHMNMGGG